MPCSHVTAIAKCHVMAYIYENASYSLAYFCIVSAHVKDPY